MTIFSYNIIYYWTLVLAKDDLTLAADLTSSTRLVSNTFQWQLVPAHILEAHI